MIIYFDFSRPRSRIPINTIKYQVLPTRIHRTHNFRGGCSPGSDPYKLEERPRCTYEAKSLRVSEHPVHSPSSLGRQANDLGVIGPRLGRSQDMI
jgi:hypothetical protein